MFTAKIRIVLLLLVSASLGFAENLPIAITNAAEAQAEGRALVQEILTARPDTNATLSGVLKIRDSAGRRGEIPVTFHTVVTAADWQTIYEVTAETNRHRLVITHNYSASANQYQHDDRKLPEAELPMAFAGSDFSAADLGLEFFHWPEQRVTRKEIRRSRSCKVLESVNPQPATNAYSKVISWIDRESHGIVQAEAYDAGGKLLKEFEPRRFRKVEGQWQLQEMEIRNVQTGSRTRIEFDAPASE